MKVAILGGGNVYAVNFANHLHKLGIKHFGIGRSKKTPAFWQVDHHYPYHALHLIDHLQAYLAILDTELPDVVVNFAAQGEGAASFTADSRWFYRTNTLGLVDLVENLRTRDYMKRFVQIGSSEVYGSVDSPSKETDCIKPSSPYAVSKAAFDQHLEIMHRISGFPMNIVRPSNAYCPGQQAHRIIPKAIICALAGQKLKLQGGGKAEKSYLHATDLSAAIMTILKHGEVGRVYNCGPESPLSIRAIVMACAAACGIDYRDLIEDAPDRVGQDSRYWLDSSRLKDLGWHQSIGIITGIAEMVEWVKRNKEELLSMDTTFKLRP